MAKVIGSLRNEAEAELSKLPGLFEKAIAGAFREISEELHKQIRENVYDKWPEAPKEYERREEDSGLADVQRYFTYSPLDSGDFGTIGASVELSYEPSGLQHQWENPARDPNEFIHRVESGTGYEWQTYDPPERPFWRPFVESMEGTSKVAGAINSQLAEILSDYDYSGSASIELQNGDGDYSY